MVSWVRVKKCLPGRVRVGFNQCNTGHDLVERCVDQRVISWNQTLVYVDFFDGIIELVADDSVFNLSFFCNVFDAGLHNFRFFFVDSFERVEVLHL